MSSRRMKSSYYNFLLTWHRFLVARLHMNSLAQLRTAHDIGQALEHLPSGESAYDETYEKTLSQICAQESKSLQVAREVFEWVLCAIRPLAMRELQHGIATKLYGQKLPTRSQLFPVDDIIEACHGLLMVSEKRETVELLHETTYAYLMRNLARLSDAKNTDPRSCQALNNEQRIFECHQAIAAVCAVYLMFDAPSAKKRGRFYDYAASWWAHHTEKGLGRELDSGVKDALLRFARDETKASRSIRTNVHFDGKRRDAEVWAKSTGLHIAAYLGLPTVVTVLADNGIHIDSENMSRKTALILALERGHIHTASALLTRGASPNRASFFSSIDVNGEDSLAGHFTPLSLAAANGSGETLTLLLKHRADPNGADADAPPDSDRAQRSKMATRRGTPLIFAVRCGHKAVVERLLRVNGIEVNLRDGNYRTARCWATKTENAEIAKLLRDHGGDW